MTVFIGTKVPSSLEEMLCKEVKIRRTSFRVGFPRQFPTVVVERKGAVLVNGLRAEVEFPRAAGTDCEHVTCSSNDKTGTHHERQWWFFLHTFLVVIS